MALPANLSFFDPQPAVIGEKVRSSPIVIASLQEIICCTIVSHSSLFERADIAVLPDDLQESLLQTMLSRPVKFSELATFIPSELTSLDLSRAMFAADSGVAKPFNCPNLTSLNVSNIFSLTNDVLRTIVGGCTALQVLHLNNNPLVGGTALAEVIAALPNLKELYLHGCKELRLPVLMEIAKTHGPHLEALDFGESNVTFPHPQSSSALFAQLPALKKLNMQCADIAYVSFESLAQSCPHLEELDISGRLERFVASADPVSDFVFMPKLRILRACYVALHQKFTDAVLQHTQLTELNLCGSKLQAMNWPLLPQLEKLEVLNVKRNNSDPETVLRMIRDEGAFPQLRRLEILDVSDAWLKILKEIRPQLEVEQTALYI